MTTAKPQAIFGVSPSAETEIIYVYPSISATGAGRLLGRLYNSIPLGNLPVRLSHLLFTLPTSPIAALIYVLQKVAGPRYSVTNREVKVWKMLLGMPSRLIGQVPLAQIERVEINQRPGQEFFRAADLILLDTSGRVLARLQGVPRADVFRQCILKARDAHLKVKSALEVISARHAAS